MRRFNGHGDWITSVVMSRDGSLICSGSLDHTVRIWQVGELNVISPEYLLDDGAVSGQLAISDNVTVVASRSNIGIVKIWSATTGAELRLFDLLDGRQTKTLAFSADSAVLR